jgi:hypothetical protein
MANNKNKYKNLTELPLNTVDDLKEFCHDLMIDVIEGGGLADDCGRLTSLMHVWLKAESMSLGQKEIEDRVAALESKERDRAQKEAMMMV